MLGIEVEILFVYEEPFDCAEGDKQKRLQRKARPEGTRPKISDHSTVALLFASLSSSHILALRDVLPS